MLVTMKLTCTTFRFLMVIFLITCASIVTRSESPNHSVFATDDRSGNGNTDHSTKRPSVFQTVGNPSGSSSRMSPAAIAALLPLVTSGGVPSFGQIITGSLKLAKPLIEAELTGRNVSVKCRADFNEILDGIASGELWALQILDSYGKPEGGILQGSKLWPGNFDQCLDFFTTALNAHLDHDNPTGFTTKYCRVTLPLGQLLPDTFKRIAESVTVGSCVSQSCSPSDISGIIVGIQSLVNITEQPLTPSDIYCIEDRPLSTGAIVFLCFLSIIGLLIITGTLYDIIVVQMQHETSSDVIKGANYDVTRHVKTVGNDVILQSFIKRSDTCENPGPLNGIGEPVVNDELSQYVNGGYEGPHSDLSTPKVYVSGLTNGGQQMKDKDIHNCVSVPKTSTKRGLVSGVLLSFSAYSNAVKILSTNQGTGSLGAINGIRFLSMAWVILGHTITFSQQYSNNALSYGIRKTMEKWTFLGVVNGTFSVDSFFTISGLLVAYLSLREIEKVGGARSFNWGMFYFHRYWRLTPVYMFVIVFGILLYPLLLTGPMRQGDTIMTACERYWWTNLLYVNNLVTEERCMGWSWYLANDMQFYVISPLLMLPLFYNLYAGVASCLVLLAVTTGLAAYIAFDHQYPAQNFSPFIPPPKDDDGFRILYIPCYTRMGPYIMGMFTGYLLYKWKCKCRINKFVNLLLWTVALCSCVAIIYSKNNHWDSNVFTIAGSAAYHSVARTAWGVVISWIVFACATGNGGWIDEVLSWKPFVPLGRLSYCAYLIHPLLMFGYHELDRTTYYFTNLTSSRYSSGKSAFGMPIPPLFGGKEYAQNVALIDVHESYLFVAHMVFSYGGAFLTSLAFEAPMMGLEKVIFKKK